MARGHRIDAVPELPLVVDNVNVDSTEALISILDKLGATPELKRSRDSRKIRQGKGKMRNSRYVMRKGPLLVYGDENPKLK